MPSDHNNKDPEEIWEKADMHHRGTLLSRFDPSGTGHSASYWCTCTWSDLHKDAKMAVSKHLLDKNGGR